eukprot:281830-Chlamydomonas_euryale.AAC.1
MSPSDACDWVEPAVQACAATLPAGMPVHGLERAGAAAEPAGPSAPVDDGSCSSGGGARGGGSGDGGQLAWLSRWREVHARGDAHALMHALADAEASTSKRPEEL